jgi:chorismate mutase
MNAQETRASALAGMALQLSLLDKLVEKNALTPEDVQSILRGADERLEASADVAVSGDFLASLRRELGIETVKG